jgi:hypothetical protein
MSGTVYEIEGDQFNDFIEAWAGYYAAAHGDNIIDAMAYHVERKAFLSGAIASINVLSVNINKLAAENMSVHEQMHTAMMSTLTEALEHAAEEFGRKP